MCDNHIDDIICIVSKKILYENCDIKIIVKSEPVSNIDSGFSFLSEFEDANSFQNTDSMEIVPLNMILKKYLDFKNFLDCPIGTIISKNNNDEFYIVENNNFNIDENNINGSKPQNAYINNKQPIKQLSQNDFYNIKKFIENNFGNCDKIYQENILQDINLNICIVPPNKTYSYYKLITIGASTIDMNIPQDLKHKNLERFELVMFFPKDWNAQFNKLLKNKQNNKLWSIPINILKNIASLPFKNNTWLGYGHTIKFKENIELTNFNSFILDIPNIILKNKLLKLENGEIVNFYCVIPILEDEINFILQNKSYDILEKIQKVNNGQIFNINRKTFLE